MAKVIVGTQGRINELISGIKDEDIIDFHVNNDKAWVGFMENNKWGYDEFRVKGEHQEHIRYLVEVAVTAPSNENFQELFDYMQTLKPK